jgi:hypothetical protein
MKIALIPPIPNLPNLPRTGIHLLLSQNFSSEPYVDYYRERRRKGDLLILDNGAHENGIGEGAEYLLSKATLVNAQEVVVPDVLFDRRGSVERTKRFLKYIVSKHGSVEYELAGSPRLMLVPQAPERAEWGVCLRAMLAAWDSIIPDHTESPVIGISKDYDNWRGGLVRLISDFVEPLYDERDFDVHLLGWSNNLWSTAEISLRFPWVRSTDSAKPFVFAKNHIRLEPGGHIPRYPRRDQEYFSKPLTPRQWEIAMVNIEVYKAAAQNELV